MQTGSMGSLGANYNNYNLSKKLETIPDKKILPESLPQDDAALSSQREAPLATMDQHLAMNLGIANEVGTIEKKEMDKEDPIEERTEATLSPAEEVDAAEQAQATEQIDQQGSDEMMMIDEMRKTIKMASGKVAKKVNKSAFKYMERNNWIAHDSRDEAAEFLTLKVPKVLAKELSRILNHTLGLDPEQASNTDDNSTALG